MHFIKLKTTFAHLIILFFLSISSQALIVKLADLHTMAKRSDIIVHGYIGEQRVVTDDLGRLITLTDVEVIDSLYGAKTGDIVTVYQVGGQKNGVVMPLLSGHHYRLGHEVILFGLKLGNAYVSYGAGQGKLDVISNNGKEYVEEDLGDITAIRNDSFGNSSLVRPMPLNFPSKIMIKNEIRKMVKSR